MDAKEKKREYMRLYRLKNAAKLKEKKAANLEKEREYHRLYYEANKEKQREYMRLYRLKNAEKLRESKAAYYQTNIVKIKAKDAAYYQANPEKIKAQKAVYYQANAEKLREGKAVYYQANTEKIKSNAAAYYKEHHREALIYAWKRQGICLRLEETWDGVYAKYAATTHCESCEVELDHSIRSTRRCNDHSHEGNCYIRGTICHLCNVHDNWKKRMTPDSIYQGYY